MQNIIIQTNDVWDYIMEHSSKLVNKMHLIASNKDFGIDIWVEGDDEGGFWIVVEEDNDEIYREQLVNEVDCNEVVPRVFKEYLEDYLQNTLTSEIGGDNYSDDYQEVIDDREAEIDFAFSDLVSTLTDTVHCDFGEGVMTDIKEHMLEYMARKHGIGIYRPMILEDVDTGEEFFTENPYENMVFDDDNPIYKK